MSDVQQGLVENRSMQSLEHATFLHNVPLTLKVELGQATLSIGDILKCGKGTVIPLDHRVGSPFVIRLEEKRIAEGEIVEAGEFLGIKVTQVLHDMNKPA